MFTGHFWPHVGGVERYSLELWRRMTERGWAVTLVTSNTHDAPAEEYVSGIRVLRMPVLRVVDGRLPVLIPNMHLYRTLDGLRHWQPDVVVTNTRFFSTSILGILLARRWGIPSLHIDHASAHVPVGSKLGDLVSQAIDHSVGTWVVRSASRCVGVSRSVAEFMGHFGRHDAGILYNGVDCSKFEARSTRWRDELGIPADACMILYVGRLIEDKGVETLERAFAALPQRAHLVVAGDGPLMPRLRERTRANPRVHLLGFVNADEIPSLLGSADIFAHPSAYPEGLPTSVLEAAAAGKAIVATPMGGTDEIVAAESSGLLVPPGDSDALSQALLRLVADAAVRQRLGEAAAARCRGTFDWERIADVAERELHALMGTPAVRA